MRGVMHDTMPTSRWAARIALLGLRSMASPPLAPTGIVYAIPPLGDSLRLEEAIEALVRLQKPVWCTSAFQDGKLLISCSPVLDSGAGEQLQEIGQRNMSEWTPIVQALCEGQSDPAVLVSSSDEAAVVPFSGPQRFTTDYFFGYSLAWQPIRPTLLPNKVCGLLIFGPPEPARFTRRVTR